MSDTYQDALAAAQARRAKRAAQFKKIEEEKNSTTGSTYTKDLFNIFSLEEGQTINIRFIADPDPENLTFWRPLSTHRLLFSSIRQPDGTIVNLPDNNKLSIIVPGWNCKSKDVAYNDLSDEYLYLSDDDPVNQKIKGMWSDDDEAAKETYRSYSVKTRYVMYGFITKYEGHPEIEGHLYRFNMNKSLYNVIKNVLSDDDYQTDCFDLQFGFDFKLTVSKNGQFKDYHTNSRFSPKVYAVPQSYIDEIEEKKFPPLKDWMMKKPSLEERNVINAMATASIEGEPFNPEWAKYYTPYNWELKEGFLRPRIQTTSSDDDLPFPVEEPEQPKRGRTRTVVNEAPAPVVTPVAPAPVATPVPASAPVAPTTNTVPSIGLDLQSLLQSLGQK